MQPPDARRPVVVVADDSEPNRELLTEMLGVRGYQVINASDGEEALTALKDSPVDLFLLDVVMPRRTGFEVCRQLKSSPETRLIPVVLVTGLKACPR